MKKIIFVIAMVLGMAVVSFGQTFGNNDSFFNNKEDIYRDIGLGAESIETPSGFSIYNQDAGSTTPLGSGLLVLTALGGAYALKKRS